MPKAIRTYVRYVDAVSHVVGLGAMYLIFVMMAILLYSTISKSFFTPSLWTLEMAQFTMVAYYILGGPHSMQLDSHVRVDLFYGNWTPKTRAIMDVFTVLALLFYLGVLLFGAFSSASYALQYGERSFSAWAPYMAPIKIVMIVGLILMILQTVAIFFKDLSKATGWKLTDEAAK
jgi:TRAP-type mannitol/chloroaromatic compound transport system permease small subunit